MTSRRAAPWVAGVVALALVVLGIVLVVAGGDDDAAAPSSTTSTTVRTGDGPTPVTLPLRDTSEAALSDLTGLVLPAGSSDFLTARLADGTQLDITFTIPADAVDAFVSASGLPAPVAGRRVVDHSTPLWKLNPEGTISGAADRHGTVARAVELVPEGGRVRVRVVVTAT